MTAAHDPDHLDEADLAEALRLYKKSLRLQFQAYELTRLAGALRGQTCLELGPERPALTHLLRQQSSEWMALRSRAVPFPCADRQFDTILLTEAQGALEDEAFIAECYRVLKPSGRFILDAPHRKPWALLQPVSGYTEPELFEHLKGGFDVQEVRTYFRFFSELADRLLRLAGRGASAPGQRAELRARFFPLAWLAAQLDALLFLSRGYRLVALSKRRSNWTTRRTPILSDGRSIAEAALRSKIGTAAPF